MDNLSATICHFEWFGLDHHLEARSRCPIPTGAFADSPLHATGRIAATTPRDRHELVNTRKQKKLRISIGRAPDENEVRDTRSGRVFRDTRAMRTTCFREQFGFLRDMRMIDLGEKPK